MIAVFVMAALGFFVVNLAIELHNHPRVLAAKIGDVATQRTLPAEFQLEDLSIPDQLPESRLRLCLLPPELPSPLSRRPDHRIIFS